MIQAGGILLTARGGRCLWFQIDSASDQRLQQTTARNTTTITMIITIQHLRQCLITCRDVRSGCVDTSQNRSAPWSRKNVVVRYITRAQTTELRRPGLLSYGSRLHPVAHRCRSRNWVMRSDVAFGPYYDVALRTFLPESPYRDPSRFIGSKPSWPTPASGTSLPA